MNIAIVIIIIATATTTDTIMLIIVSRNLLSPCLPVPIMKEGGCLWPLDLSYAWT
jgi:hypothetical protein